MRLSRSRCERATTRGRAARTTGSHELLAQPVALGVAIVFGVVAASSLGMVV
jgi:hypothetical protein